MKGINMKEIKTGMYGIDNFKICFSIIDLNKNKFMKQQEREEYWNNIDVKLNDKSNEIIFNVNDNNHCDVLAHYKNKFKCMTENEIKAWFAEEIKKCVKSDERIFNFKCWNTEKKVYLPSFSKSKYQKFTFTEVKNVYLALCS